MESEYYTQKRNTMNGNTELAKGVTIEKYIDWLNQKDKVKISNMVYQRLFERYLKPYSYPSGMYKKNYKNGFAMMGSACLLIETYMAFKKGEEDSDKKGRDFFCEFFNSEVEFEIFKDERKNSHGHFLKEGIPSKFYKNIRCGILHQGETNEGWTITRKKEIHMFDKTTLKINAYLFTSSLDKVLIRYKRELLEKDWEDDLWKNLRCKLNFIIQNSQKIS